MGLLIAALTGHGDFKEYHQRFQPQSFLYYSRKADRYPTQLVFCQITRIIAKRYTGKREINEALDWLLGTAEERLLSGVR